MPGLRLKDVPPASAETKLAWEKELLGLYVSGHPLDKYRERLEKRETNIKKIKEEMKDDMLTMVAGIVEEAKEITTKRATGWHF